MSSPRKRVRTSSLPSSPLEAGSTGSRRTDDEEAEEVVEREPVDDPEDEEEEGENLMERPQRDYVAIPELDRYDPSQLDEAAYDEMDASQRRAAEAAMQRRDAARLQGRVSAAFLDGEEGDDPSRMRRRRRADAGAMDIDTAAIEEAPLENLQDMKGHSLREWVSQANNRTAIKQRFAKFLTTYTDQQGHSVYAERIKAMGLRNGESFAVSYAHLFLTNQLLTTFLCHAPAEMLAIFDEVALENTLAMFPNYRSIQSEVHVRITDLPALDSLRDLRHTHLNCLVRVAGVVTRRTNVLPQLKYVKYDCGKCSYTLGPIFQNTTEELHVGSCPNCQSKGPFTVNASQTVYRNYQKLTLQESPGTVPAGRLPRQKEVVLLRDLIDSARPGEEIEVIGIYRNNFDAALNTKNGFPVFATVIEANIINKREDQFAAFKLTDDDMRTIRTLAEDPNIGERLVKSFAPSIYGHRDVKRALALSLFGGSPKQGRGELRIRGDINVLLLGDPGTAKSQFLKYVEKTSHRAIYATGQGASAVGLTASVHRDAVTREWTLEGGALVLADRGVCLIDEFDKMNDSDRTSIHEAMEQQSISISKAGIVTTLQARCAVIAAANPIKGRYDSSVSFSRNVDLTEPILSRFDALCVVKDVVDPIQDDLLASFVVASHIKNHPEYNPTKDIIDTVPEDPTLIPQDVLKKYIMYAREHAQPRLTTSGTERIASLYEQLRQESISGDSIPVTVRLVESIIRMSEAHARMHLRSVVQGDDIDMAIRVCLESFINAQKYSLMRQMRRSFSKYLSFRREHTELLMHLLEGMVQDEVAYYQVRHVGSDGPHQVRVSMQEFAERAKEYNVFDVLPFYESPTFRDRFRLEHPSIVMTLD